MLTLPIVLATLWCAAAAELAIASARAGGRALVFIDRVLVVRPPEETIPVLCLVSASGALALAIAVARARGRRLERRMAAELDARWADLADREVDDGARTKLLSWRVAELQALVDELLAEREAARPRPAPHLVIVSDPPDGGTTPAATTARSRR